MARSFTPHQLSIAFDDWPVQDQRAWETAIFKGDILYDDGPLTHWAERTRYKAVKNYGHWLCYLKGKGTLLDPTKPQERITPEAVNAYLGDMQNRLASTTIFMRLVDLLSLAQAFAPEENWEWLRKLRRRLEARMKPSKNKDQRIVHSTKLWQLGFDLMKKAETASNFGPRTAAHLYRDGLLIALLSARPLRMKNMASLTIGRHLLRHSDRYQIEITAQETKTKRAINFDIPDDLTNKLDTYLEVHRIALLENLTSDRLWISLHGTEASQHALACAIRTQTKKAFGKLISPHLFRDCAATSLALDNPEFVRSAAAILGHASLKTTLHHYDQSQKIKASSLHQEEMLELRQRLREKDSSDTPLNINQLD